MGAFNEGIMYWGAPCKHGHNAPRYISSGHCIECKKVICKKWRQANYSHELVKAKEWRDRNREHLRERERRRYHSSSRKRDRDREWKKNNQHIFTALQIKREAAKKKRTPKWADLKKIREFYREAARLTKQTGIEHHVDHVVPLLGETVCGLHVEHNLRVVTAAENMLKKNKWDAVDPAC